jgi:serine/threonine-protein kinase
MTHPTEHAAPTFGSLFAGRYRIDSLLGQGGMGVVLGVMDEALGTPCAVKLLNRPDVRVSTRRVIREGQALMRISSRHVVRILDVGELAPWGPYLVLERLSGNNLAELAPLGRPWPWSTAVSCAVQACDALAAAHAVGIVHRDVKPSNLFLAEEGNERVLKVLDFGIAKQLGAGQAGSSTLTHGALGSPQFMSPEQIATPRAVDARTDLWALGVVVFRLVTGRYPFTGASIGEITAAVLRARPPSLAESGGDAPPALQAVLDRCLRAKPDDRWPSAGELGRALREVR